MTIGAQNCSHLAFDNFFEQNLKGKCCDAFDGVVAIKRYEFLGKLFFACPSIFKALHAKAAPKRGAKLRASKETVSS